MIIQALVEYYESLAAQGKIAKPGWCQAKISYGLNISKSGELLGVLTLTTEEKKGNKTVTVPRLINLPQGAVGRTSGFKPQFMWDNAGWILGLSMPGKSKDPLKCFQVTADLANKVLENTKSENAEAIKSFFNKWNPETIQNNEILAAYLEDFTKGSNIVFMVEGNMVSDDIGIGEAWDNYYNSLDNGTIERCAILGRQLPVARKHPKIKGIPGGQPSGMALVSFNEKAFESYGHEQGMNANISKYAAFAYTTALNTLLADSKHYQRIGDTTIVFWAEQDDDGCAELFGETLNDPNELKEEDLKAFFENASKGKTFEFNEKLINPNNKFYILGLSPNAARLSVRFFMVNSFGFFLTNLARYFQELEIVKPSYDNKGQLAIWQILQETANKNSKDKSATPLLVGSVLRSVLMGTKYPSALYQNIILRVKADQDNPDKFIDKISRIKAAVIKAYLMRNEQEKGEITVSLDVEKMSTPYVLGRLFAYLEQIQEEANPGINSTIKDRYFNSACSTPGVVFPLLMRLSESHMKKIGGAGNKGKAIWFDKNKTDLLGRINAIPTRLSLTDQGEFILGYYHQYQARFIKKEEK